MTTAENFMIICIVLQALLILGFVILTFITMTMKLKKYREELAEYLSEWAARAAVLSVLIAGIGCSLFLILTLHGVEVIG